MKKSKKIFIGILICVLVISAFVMGAFFAMQDRLTVKLIGEENMVLELGQEYTELGCSSSIGDFSINDIEILGNVDTSTPGIYKITYTASFLSQKVSAVRTVRIKDSILPTITAPEELELFVGVKLEDAEFECSAYDNFDGDITSRMTAKYGEDSITLYVTDTSGNSTSKKIQIVRLKDTTAPTIKLSGSANFFLMIGQDFNDPGFKATDNIDGDITLKVEVSGADDIIDTGNHTITYTVTDSSGNTASVSRNVFVYDPSESKNNADTEDSRTIYLTFDDGPCIYTPKILDILAKYNVKATFFVTNQKPNSQKYIAEAYKQGHAIGAHTYSHKYSIYKSVDSYFEDLDAINEVIKTQTGSYTRLIRFPGGSSNTISKSYKKGIMSQLVKEVTDRGYIYFDWNVVSGDADSTSKKNNPDYIVSNVKNRLKSGTNVVLMHDINSANIEALPQIIEYSLSNGYVFLPLNESSPTAHHTVMN